MLHVVEVRRIGSDLVGWMAEMRAWLDHNGIEPAAFEHSAGGPGVAFRLSFNAAAEAETFVQAFQGRLSLGTDPHGAALWPGGATEPAPGSGK